MHTVPYCITIIIFDSLSPKSRFVTETIIGMYDTILHANSTAYCVSVINIIFVCDLHSFPAFVRLFFYYFGIKEHMSPKSHVQRLRANEAHSTSWFGYQVVGRSVGHTCS